MTNKIMMRFVVKSESLFPIRESDWLLFHFSKAADTSLYSLNIHISLNNLAKARILLEVIESFC